MANRGVCGQKVSISIFINERGKVQEVGWDAEKDNVDTFLKLFECRLDAAPS